MNRLTAVMENYRPGLAANNQVNVRTEYRYDAHGNRISMKNAKLSVTSYQYDAVDRLKKEIDPINEHDSIRLQFERAAGDEDGCERCDDDVHIRRRAPLSQLSVISDQWSVARQQPVPLR